MGAPGFIGRSPFDWNIRYQYVPTVGVIYTIPVSFPLVNPDEEAKGQESSESKTEEQDLWEKHEKGVQEGRGISIAPGSVTVGKMKVAAPGMGMAGPAGNPFGNSMSMMAFGGPQAPAYDPEAVKSLRGTLIDVLAHYGYRLDDLPKDEQILFIVTSSSTPAVGYGSVFIKSGDTDKGTEVFVPGAATESGSGDQYLLAIKKTDVTAKSAPEDIESKLTERLF
jgi:hypothetical protein